MTTRPNFLVIVTDDQGYGDLSCLGNDYVRTPNLDGLCASGARFTDWYANGAVCSPTRAALLTGRYPGRAGIGAALPGHRQAVGLPEGVPTIPRLLNPLGYRSYLSGKWHLGAAEECRPDRHGFDSWFGHLGGCIDYFSHIFYWGMNRPGPGVNPVHDLWKDGHEVRRNGEYMTELITEQAIEDIRDAVTRDRPFFLDVSYNAPHYPMHAPEEYMARFAHLPWDRQVMAAMLAAVDDGVGRILGELDRLGIRDDTCVFFTSDNGPSVESRNWLNGRPDPYYGGSTGAFRGHKQSLFEGGIRVPGAVAWPGRIPSGQVLDAPCATMDILPTILTAAGAGEVAAMGDGVDLLPSLSGEAPMPERDLFWEHRGQLAARRGRHKLVLGGALQDQDAPPESPYLTDLAVDPGESQNIAAEHPELTAELAAAVAAWREDVNRTPAPPA